MWMIFIIQYYLCQLLCDEWRSVSHNKIIQQVTWYKWRQKSDGATVVERSSCCKNRRNFVECSTNYIYSWHHPHWLTDCSWHAGSFSEKSTVAYTSGWLTTNSLLQVDRKQSRFELLHSCATILNWTELRASREVVVVTWYSVQLIEMRRFIARNKPFS